MQVRRVVPGDDFLQLGGIYAQSWKAAYAHLVPEAYLEGLDAERWAPNLASLRYDTLVVEDGGRYVGTACVAPARDARWRGWGEVVSIYLLPDCFGKGYGSPLIAACVQALKEKGFDRIYLWVLEGNDRARRFYEKNGFVATEDQKVIDIGGKALQERRYVYQGA